MFDVNECNLIEFMRCVKTSYFVSFNYVRATASGALLTIVNKPI